MAKGTKVVIRGSTEHDKVVVGVTARMPNGEDKSVDVAVKAPYKYWLSINHDDITSPSYHLSDLESERMLALFIILCVQIDLTRNCITNNTLLQFTWNCLRYIIYTGYQRQGGRYIDRRR